MVGMLALGFLSADWARAEEAPAVRSAVERYFKAWSDQDMVAYQACFHPDAVIFFAAENGRLMRNMLVPFIESQRLAHAASSAPMREVPTKIEINTSAKFASAVVHWELTKSDAVKRGVDVFTFVKQGGEWKIGSLVFGEDD